MTIFYLPDLGEGLPDAEIHAWFVNEGDEVKTDAPLVSMETAKAVVDVPCPQDGRIIKFYGKPGDVIKTGDPLVEFEMTSTKSEDKGTVVGNLEESTEISDDNFIIGASVPQGKRIKTTPAIRLLAKRLNIDLHTLTGTGEHGTVTRKDVERAAEKQTALPHGFEPLRGVRRAMLNAMVRSHQDVVPVSIFDEADVTAWFGQGDITVRIIRALCAAIKKEPALNAWYDTTHAARHCFEELHLGLAMDNDEGLFVPVIHEATHKSDTELRETINAFKTQVMERSIAPEQLKGATITLSNFGKFAGKFASPIIVPPTVAILAVGRLYEGIMSINGVAVSRKILPLSLSFDHRAVTGGEATRFLGAIMDELNKA